MANEAEIKLFENVKVRSQWDAEQEKWYISIVDVVRVLTESPNPNNYWKVLKNRLKKEGNESVTNCNQLKLQSSDGKLESKYIGFQIKFRALATVQMNTEYGALPRPHVAKDFIPGSDNWDRPEYSERVKYLINNPDFFINLDFTSLPSEITHIDENFRKLTSKYYMDMCAMPDSLTQYIRPINQGMSDKDLFQIKVFNSERYDF